MPNYFANKRCFRKTCLDRYYETMLISESDICMIYHVEDLVTSKEFALKVYNYGFKYTKIAHKEMSILRKLEKYPNFVKHFENFSCDGNLCVTQELLDVDLKEIAKKISNNEISNNIIKNIIKQIVEALNYLNQENIVHANLKLENICLLEEENGKFLVKLIDFAESFTTFKKDHFDTQCIFYRAPEAILGLEYDIRIDIWSFSCIIFEFLTDRILFPSSSNFNQLEGYLKLLGKPNDDLILSEAIETFLAKNVKYCEKENLQNNKKDSLNFLEMNEFKLIINKLNQKKSDNSLLRDFILCGLKINPKKRKTAKDLLNHPYLKNIELLSEKLNISRKRVGTINDPFRMDLRMTNSSESEETN